MIIGNDNNNNEDKTYNDEDIMMMLKCEESSLTDNIKEKTFIKDEDQVIEDKDNYDDIDFELWDTVSQKKRMEDEVFKQTLECNNEYINDDQIYEINELS